VSRWDEMWEYLRKLYEQAGREYTVWGAGFYERNEPWFLAGLQVKVQRAIERKEAADGQPAR
jgi:hypothetical protein